MSEYLSDSSIIVESSAILFFRFWVINVFWNLDQPVTKLYFSVNQNNVFGVDMGVYYVVFVEKFYTLEERGESIDEFIFCEKIPGKGPFAVIQLNPQIGVCFGVEQAVSIEERPEEMGVFELLWKWLRLFNLEIVESLFSITID